MTMPGESSPRPNPAFEYDMTLGFCDGAFTLNPDAVVGLPAAKSVLAGMAPVFDAPATAEDPHAVSVAIMRETLAEGVLYDVRWHPVDAMGQPVGGTNRKLYVASPGRPFAYQAADTSREQEVRSLLATARYDALQSQFAAGDFMPEPEVPVRPPVRSERSKWAELLHRFGQLGAAMLQGCAKLPPWIR